MLQQQAENLWTVDHELRLGPGIPFPSRMTVVRLPDGSLGLISPTPIDDSLAEELRALGPVSHLLAPNRLHHLNLPSVKKRYPDARLLGVPGLEVKQPSLAFEPLEPERFSSLKDALSAQPIGGAPKISETVLLHRPSRTLIVTDLVFNVETAPSWTTAALLFTMGAHGGLAQSRAWSFMLEDASSARGSCERLFDWDFDRLVVAHGDVVSSGAKERLAAALTRTGSPAAFRLQAGAR